VFDAAIRAVSLPCSKDNQLKINTNNKNWNFV
jgi:hypothetical protein